jgi:hypothetical protein
MNMFSNSSKVTNICSVALLALLLVAPNAAAQKPKRKRVVGAQAAASTQSTPPISEEEKKKLSETVTQLRANLLTASKAYRESLEKLVVLQKQDEERIASNLEKQRQLLDLGVIAKREMEESEQALKDARSRAAATQKQIAEVDELVAEVNAVEELAKTATAQQGTYHSTGLLVRYVGASRWALSDFNKVDAFFRLKFGRPLPVSAIGQSDTHNRLGFDHSDAVDVAIHPDSEEGKELINYLASQGISFIAIRGAIPGSATGAHIHIGPPSKRITGH